MVVEMTKSFYQDRRDLNKLENQVKKKISGNGENKMSRMK